MFLRNRLRLRCPVSSFWALDYWAIPDFSLGLFGDSLHFYNHLWSIGLYQAPLKPSVSGGGIFPGAL